MARTKAGSTLDSTGVALGLRQNLALGHRHVSPVDSARTHDCQRSAGSHDI